MDDDKHIMINALKITKKGSNDPNNGNVD